MHHNFANRDTVESWKPTQLPLLRLKEAVLACHNKEWAQVGKSDLIALVRHYLLLLAFQNPEGLDVNLWLSNETLTFPDKEGWPTGEDWKDAGFRCWPAKAKLQIQLTSLWEPSWKQPDQPSPLERLYQFQSEPLTRKRTIPGDPWWKKALGYTEFNHVGQQAAVYQALLAQPGHCYVFLLPTGSGKTAIFHGLLHQFPDKVHILVVPTTALAIDQASRLQDVLGQEQVFAYHSGLSAPERKSLRDGLKNGNCKAVITSPEAIELSLRDSLFKVAEQGRLHSITLDEAHMISQWGNDFRPSFQNLSNFHRALLGKVPDPSFRHRMFFLTATLTQDGLDTIADFFAPSHSPIHITAFNHLRPEPEFWVHECDNNDHRLALLQEALLYLPRPWIIYVTKVKDACFLYEQLQEWGHVRIARITGGGGVASPFGETQEEILAGWRERKFDGVVATSAFGLGVDLGDVRAVVHACIPETVDRFYQEVGRAGRDGRACLSLVLWTKDDEPVAKSLNREVIISPKRAFERWDKMRKHGRPEGSYLVVDLDQRPADLPETSTLNQSWNLRTLLLLQRSNLIEFAQKSMEESLSIHDVALQENDSKMQEEIAKYFREVPLKLLHPELLDSEQGIAEAFEPLRAKISKASRQSLESMYRFLRGEKSITRILRETYQQDNPINHAPSPHILSCPHTRNNRTPWKPTQLTLPKPVIYPYPTCTTTEPPLPIKNRGTSSNNNTQHVLWVTYNNPNSTQLQRKERKKTTQRFNDIIEWAVSQGVVEIVLPEQLEQSPWYFPKEWKPDVWHKHSPHSFVSIHANREQTSLLQEWGFPRLSFWTSNDLTEDGSLPIQWPSKEAHPCWEIVLLPEETKDFPPRTDRNFVEIYPSISLQQLLETYIWEY